MIRPSNLLHLPLKQALQAKYFRKLLAITAVLAIVPITIVLGLAHSSTQANTHLDTHTTPPKHSLNSDSITSAAQDSSVPKQPGTSADPAKKDSSTKPGQNSYIAQSNGAPGGRHLVITPSTINLSGVGAQCASFTIATSDGLPVTIPPTFSNTPITFATIGDWLKSNQGKAWPASVCKIELMSGQGTIAISAHDVSNNIVTGTLTVNVAFTPYFTAVQGSVSQVSSNNGYGDIVIFTFPFTIAPSAGFGNPMLRFSMAPGPSCTGGTTSIVANYNGQNTYALTCIMSKSQAEAYGGCFSATILGTADDRDGGFSFNYTPCYKP